MKDQITHTNAIAIPYEDVKRLIWEAQFNLAKAIWKEYGEATFKEKGTYNDEKGRCSILNDGDFATHMIALSKMPEDMIVLKKYLEP